MPSRGAHTAMSQSFQLSCLDAALSIAQAAGRILAEGAFRRHASESKSTSADLVTRYDRAAEEVICAHIASRFPDHRILAEESGDHGGASDRPRWIIDPLDGTTNFAHGLPLFSVSIACEWEGQVRVGVVHAPALGWTFSAGLGLGAFRNGERLAVSQAPSIEQALLVTGFPYDRKTARDNNFAQFLHLKRRAQGIRRLGSAALDLSLVAAGSLDGYWEMKLKPWDIAAGLLLASEAGAKLSDWQGRPVELSRGEVLCANPHLHAELLAALRHIEHGVFAP